MRQRALAAHVIARLVEHQERRFVGRKAWNAHLEALGIPALGSPGESNAACASKTAAPPRGKDDPARRHIGVVKSALSRFSRARRRRSQARKPCLPSSFTVLACGPFLPVSSANVTGARGQPGKAAVEDAVVNENRSRGHRQIRGTRTRRTHRVARPFRSAVLCCFTAPWSLRTPACSPRRTRMNASLIANVRSECRSSDVAVRPTLTLGRSGVRDGCSPPKVRRSSGGRPLPSARPGNSSPDRNAVRAKRRVLRWRRDLRRPGHALKIDFEWRLYHPSPN
jgi:hypothetical protein